MDSICNVKPSWHGTLNGYTHRKCRCEECREAWRLYIASYRAKKKAAVAEAPTQDNRPLSVDEIETLYAVLWLYQLDNTSENIYAYKLVELPVLKHTKQRLYFEARYRDPHERKIVMRSCYVEKRDLERGINGYRIGSTRRMFIEPSGSAYFSPYFVSEHYDGKVYFVRRDAEAVLEARQERARINEAAFRNRAPRPGGWLSLIFGSPRRATDEEIAALKIARNKAHPDAGGSHEAFIEANARYQEALAA